jgi:hypothetical protein
MRSEMPPDGQCRALVPRALLLCVADAASGPTLVKGERGGSCRSPLTPPWPDIPSFNFRNNLREECNIPL